MVYRKDITCAWSKGLYVVYIPQNATHACVCIAPTLTENDLANTKGQLYDTTDKAKQGSYFPNGCPTMQA